MARLPQKGSPPPRPPFPLSALYGSKKLDSESFQLKQVAAKFSANIIWLLFYLFAKSSCLWAVEISYLIYHVI